MTVGELAADKSRLQVSAGSVRWADGEARYRDDGSGVELTALDGRVWSFGFDGQGLPRPRVPAAKAKPRAGR